MSHVNEVGIRGQQYVVKHIGLSQITEICGEQAARKIVDRTIPDYIRQERRRWHQLRKDETELPAYRARQVEIGAGIADTYFTRKLMRFGYSEEQARDAVGEIRTVYRFFNRPPFEKDDVEGSSSAGSPIAVVNLYNYFPGLLSFAMNDAVEILGTRAHEHSHALTKAVRSVYWKPEVHNLFGWKRRTIKRKGETVFRGITSTTLSTDPTPRLTILGKAIDNGLAEWDAWDVINETLQHPSFASLRDERNERIASAEFQEGLSQLDPLYGPFNDTAFFMNFSPLYHHPTLYNYTHHLIMTMRLCRLIGQRLLPNANETQQRDEGRRILDSARFTGSKDGLKAIVATLGVADAKLVLAAHDHGRGTQKAMQTIREAEQRLLAA